MANSNREQEVLNAENEDEATNSTGKSTPNPDFAIPIDGGWGWFVVLGSFLIHVITDGIVYSFGIFYIEFLDEFKSNTADTTWIASLMVGCIFLSGPVTSAYADHEHIPGYNRSRHERVCRSFQLPVTAITGSVIASAGFILSTFATNIGVLYFTFGIMGGVGIGFIYLAAIVSVGQYFDRYLSLAMGFAVCGSGVGTFLFAPLSQALVSTYTWRGAIIIMSGLLLNCAVCGALFRPLLSENEAKEKALKTVSKHQRKRRKKTAAERINSKERGDNEVNSGTQALFINDQVQCSTLQHNTNKNQGEYFGLVNFIRDVKLNIVKISNDFKLLKDIPFLLFTISAVLASIGYNAPFLFLPHQAQLSGIDDQSGAFLISAIGIANTVARVVFGFVGNLLGKKRMYLYCTALLISGLSTALVPLATTYPWMLVFAAVYGSTLGTYVTLTAVILVDLFGLEKLVASFGVVLLFEGIATIIGPPLLGRFYDATGSYSHSFIFAGLVVAVSGFMLYIIPCIEPALKRRKQRKLSRTNVHKMI